MAILARAGWHRTLFFSGVLAFLLCTRAYGQEQPLQLYEQKIKAGLIYNFIKYTEWPSSKMAAAEAPIVACIFGEDPFDGYLQPIEDRTVKQHSIIIREIDTVADTESCHLLFIGAEKKDMWPRVRDFLAGKSVLTVGDFPGFSGAGGMIQFGKASGHIYMELNIEAIRDARLRVYDGLIKISRTMRPASGGGQ